MLKEVWKLSKRALRLLTFPTAPSLSISSLVGTCLKLLELTNVHVIGGKIETGESKLQEVVELFWFGFF